MDQGPHRKDRKGHPWREQVKQAEAYLSVSHLSFFSWLCPGAEKRALFLSPFSIGNLDFHDPRIT